MMTLKNLKQELIQKNIPSDAYSLNGGLPNESFCIGYTDSLWEVYYSERGNKTEKKTFESEEKACEYFLFLMKKYFKN